MSKSLLAVTDFLTQWINVMLWLSCLIATCPNETETSLINLGCNQIPAVKMSTMLLCCSWNGIFHLFIFYNILPFHFSGSKQTLKLHTFTSALEIRKEKHFSSRKSIVFQPTYSRQSPKVIGFSRLPWSSFNEALLSYTESVLHP